MIAIIQPIIPHYREKFFLDLKNKIAFDLYTFNDKSDHRSGINKANILPKKLSLYQLGKLRWFNPFLLFINYKTIVLCGELSLIANWLILFLGKVFNKNILVLGHGLSYEKNTPINFGHFLMYYLCKGAIFYTSKELKFWQRKFPEKKMISYQNTLEVDLLYFSKLVNKNMIKKKYNISQKLVFISCHRFSNPNRRHDYLKNVIEKSNKDNEAFIIIGDGRLKPDFTKHSNVYDFGEVWDNKLKSDLFFISDFYIQFGWTGLSIVEAMAYSLPIITSRRSLNVKQSVEYFYLKNNFNAILLNDIEHFSESYKISDERYKYLSKNAFSTYHNKLQMSSMVNTTYQYLNYYS